MSLFGDAIYGRLNGYSGLTDLVGVTNIHQVKLPQDVSFPAVSFQEISATRVSVCGSDSGVVRARVQVSSWSDDSSPREAALVADQVRGALQRWNGTAGSVVVDEIFLLNEVQLYHDDTELFQHVIDFEVIHRE